MRSRGPAALEINVADKSLRAYTTGPTANVDAATQVSLGNPLGPLLPIARVTDKTAADASMTAWIAAVSAQSLVLAQAGFGVAATPPVDFGKITTGSGKAFSE